MTGKTEYDGTENNENGMHKRKTTIEDNSRDCSTELSMAISSNMRALTRFAEESMK